MPDIADLEIGLAKQAENTYTIDFRFKPANGDADIRLIGSAIQIHIDLESFKELGHDMQRYGLQLGACLFANPEVKAAFDKAVAITFSSSSRMRVRLFIDANAAELQCLRWESLSNPETKRPLFQGEQCYFSRYLSCGDWRPVGPRAKRSIRTLIAVGAPKDLAKYKLAEIDRTHEIERIQNCINLPSVVIPSGEDSTFALLSQELRKGYDLLYLVCHGKFRRDDSWLFLEDQEGNTQRISGRQFTEILADLEHIPRLIVLISCQSAGDEYDFQASLGPQLAEAGVPAVLAMRGNISFESVNRFLPVFFSELMDHGYIDRALSVARGVIRDQSDWWIPTLFCRLKSGRLWYAPGFSDSSSELEKWPALMRHIKRGRCTPIIGPGLNDALFGSKRETASRWAHTYHYPMLPHYREELPQVAQYLAINQDIMFPYEELLDDQLRNLEERYPRIAPGADLKDKITAVGKHLRQNNKQDPYALLARLPLPIYITADATSLLEDALRECGRKPHVELCRWNRELETLPSLFDREPDYRPQIDEPLVYHLFGTLDEPDSLVITEDNYFDFLIGATGNKDLIPIPVRRALADSSLLFMGFQITDWEFRVLFRGLMNREGSNRRRRYSHIAVQVDPEAHSIIEPEGARRYLEAYFGYADISIFWGRSKDFISELDLQLKKAGL